jgi:molecular chaperone GrpE
VAAVSEMDEEPARPAACPDSAGLSELASRLGRVEEELAGFNQRSAHREAVIDQLNSAIDQLHEENQLLKAGLSRMVLEPVITDLIRLHDQLSLDARRQAGDGQDAAMAWSFVDEVAQLLERCGIDTFTAEPGDRFDPSRHHALAVAPGADEAQHKTVAEVLGVGFTDRDTGHVRRPLQARFHQYLPEQ